MNSQYLSVTNQEAEKAEFADFEIVRGRDQPAQAVSPWPAFRILLMGFIGLALIVMALIVGAIILVPLLIFIAVVRILSSLLPGQRR